MAIDLRGHGDSNSSNDEDLSADTQSSDVISIIQSLFPENCPDLVLVGHSMGGAICVHVAAKQELPTLKGVIVIDVVEGSAMEALTSMQSFLRSRPSHFKSIEQAIEWSVRSGQIRNVQSAKVSMPGQIVNCQTGKLGTNEVLEHKLEAESPDRSASPGSNQEFDFKIRDGLKNYTWRVDLSKSEQHWQGWFNGLSEKFLNLREAKLLILAGIAILDKTLTVGQMQGKFQIKVLARCGHAVHEDLPHDVAEVVGSFLLRNKFSTPIGDFVRKLPDC